LPISKHILNYVIFISQRVFNAFAPSFIRELSDGSHIVGGLYDGKMQLCREESILPLPVICGKKISPVTILLNSGLILRKRPQQLDNRYTEV